HRECSPGTSVFWDAGYRRNIPDLPFLWAAVVATRVVSHPERDLFCLDLGYKAIAAEQPFPRAQFLNGEDLTEVGHSEEHLVVRAANPDRYRIGQLLYAVPRHICPTVSLYDEALVVDTGRVVDRWPVAARRRELLATSVPD